MRRIVLNLLSYTSLPARCGLLAALAAAVYPLLAWYAVSRYGGDGAWAVAAAGGLCLAGGLVSLVIVTPCLNTPRAVSGVLGGMLVRLAIPIAGVIPLAIAYPRLAAAGLVGYLVVYYLVTLTFETMILVAVLSAGQLGSIKVSAHHG